MDELEKIHGLAGRNPNILFNECMKRLDSVRAELIMAGAKVDDAQRKIIETINQHRGQ